MDITPDGLFLNNLWLGFCIGGMVGVIALGGVFAILAKWTGKSNEGVKGRKGPES